MQVYQAPLAHLELKGFQELKACRGHLELREFKASWDHPSHHLRRHQRLRHPPIQYRHKSG